MKKVFAVLSLVLVLCLCGSALTEGMGVQVIGGPTTESEPISLDDVKLEREITIDNYGVFCFTKAEFVDYLCTYEEGQNDYCDRVYCSGSEAQYFLLRADILNNTVSAKDYLRQVEIVVYYDDVFEYGGWCYQYNYNNKSKGFSYVKLPDGSWVGDPSPTNFVIDPKDNFSISPMYEGHYVFGCTLPNAIVESKKPLRMVVTIDGNEITYNIRK